MKRTISFAVLLAVAVCSAWAQGPGGPGGRRDFMGGPMGGGLMLLNIPEVQKELKMTQPQIEKLQAKMQEVRQSMRELMQGAGGPQAFGNMSNEERQKLFAKMAEISNKAAADILDTTQLKRFKQLEIQRQGAQAFRNPEVVNALQLTQEQNDKIAGVLRDMMQAMRDAMQGVDFRNMTDDDRAKLQATQKRVSDEAMSKIQAILSDAQKAKWKEMTGAPFTFPAFRMPGGRRPAA
ncbi:MAG: hypothetical protein ACP5VE_12570 [Chthonomonadales bacterium]